jgi:hypothetical protein
VPAGRPAGGGSVRLTRGAGPLPAYLEVSLVAGDWTSRGGIVTDPPVPGTAVAAARPRPSDPSVTFDVSRVIRAAGRYAFAVTAPTGRQPARFARGGADGPQLLFTGALGDRIKGRAIPAGGRSARRLATSVNRRCQADAKLLVPNCGVLWGVAPAARTSRDRSDALQEFEQRTGRPQAVYHAYHRGTELFPTAEEIAIAHDADHPRLLFLNWKPTGVSWARIARGDQRTDAYLDRLAGHIKSTFTEPFFFTVHHEPSNDVRPHPAAGRTADDYAKMYRHVIERLRGDGVTNLVSTMVYLAYPRQATRPWFADLYPGDDVVDWVAWDVYAYSRYGGYGFGDLVEMMNRDADEDGSWPGFYVWAAQQHPGKPLMVSEWGLWYSRRNPRHQARFFTQARDQLRLFPRIKGLLYFETPNNAKGMDSRVDRTTDGLRAFRALARDPSFDVRLPRNYGRRLVRPADVGS